jgi:hypothetical protein
MKNIKNILMICVASIFLYSCDTTNEADYLPENYILPTTLTLTETEAADTSFDVSYTSSSLGKGYYVAVPSGTDAPTATQVHSGSGFMQSGSFDVDGITATSITIDTDIFGGYVYDVYAIHKSEDNFISETVTKLTVTTPDTEDPTFLGETSSPAHRSGGNSPTAAVSLNFSEPVFYQGGDITFTAFTSDRTVIVNTASALSKSGTNISIDTHGTFEQDDIIIVSWSEDTFKDNAGKSVAALTGFSHYFGTRVFTAPEAAALMVGLYNYEAVFYGGNVQAFYDGNAALFLPKTGQFELKLDPTDPTATTLLGINVFSPLNNYGDYGAPSNLKIKFGAEGALAVLDTPQNCGIPFGVDTIWLHYNDSATVTNPGAYNVTTGQIAHYLTAVVKDTAYRIDDLDYVYTRIGTFAKPSSEEMEKRNKFLQKKKEQSKNYRGLAHKALEILK